MLKKQVDSTHKVAEQYRELAKEMEARIELREQRTSQPEGQLVGELGRVGGCVDQW